MLLLNGRGGLVIDLEIAVDQQSSRGLQRRSEGGRTSPPPCKRESRAKNNFFGAKNLKTLKVGSLFVSVNSEP